MKQVLKCGHLFLTRHKRFAADQNVYVEDGRITAVSWRTGQRGLGGGRPGREVRPARPH